MTGRDDTAPAVRVARARHRGGSFVTLRVWWAKVTEPRHLSVIFGGVYTVAMLTGWATLAVPPQTIANELGPALSVAWAVLFIAGGLLGMVTVLPGWWQWERWGIYFCAAGIGIYGYVIVHLHFTSEGSRLTQLGILAFGLALFAVRFSLIWGRTYGPRG